jgi:hypothetical protein
MSTELTSEEVETVNSWLAEDVTAGKLTHEQAIAIGRDEIPPPPAPLFPGDISPAAHHGEYRFPLYQVPDQGEVTARAEDRKLREFIYAAGFDAARGSQFGKAIIESVQKTQHSTEFQKAIFGIREFKSLSWSEDTWNSRAPAIR